MKISLRQLLISILSLLVSLATVIYFTNSHVLIGSLPLLARAIILSIAILFALLALFPFNPAFIGRPGTYSFAVCLPAVLPVFVYFLFFLPSGVGVGFSAEQIQSQLITDGSSNGIIEVGFSYPIYTPTLKIRNNELYTRQVNVFLRITDASDRNFLFRAVRSRIPGSGLSVESSAQAMLSENSEYIFIPLSIPPQRSSTGRLVFVISSLEEGATFREMLDAAVKAQFELRDPVNDQLLLEFPLDPL